MLYSIEDINREAKTDPKGFIERSEAAYHDRIEKTVELLVKRQKEKPILLINGPSSSGKTTTARLIGQAFLQYGIHAEVISMDDYYRTRGSYIMPKDEYGLDDLEAPECMDLPLLHDHLAQLAAGKEIQVPRYSFAEKRRTEETETVRLDPDEVAVIEGIHSLSDVLTGGLEDKATGLHLSVDSQVVLEDGTVLTADLLRFMRRAVRDRNFRGAPVQTTLRQWRSVRRGERLYIVPYLHHATLSIDTYLPYESCILMNQLQGEIAHSEDAMRDEGLGALYDAIGSFALIDFEPYIPENSLLHEFIG
ncbi:MAG: nucleoside kinase [Clostridia bacterium]|nr:nucleoside kinase [Clostridia bacterium]